METISFSLSVLLSFFLGVSHYPPLNPPVKESVNQNVDSNILEGNYFSVKGVMDPLSCYCFNGGYLITKNKQEIPICFEDDAKIDCSQITVQGQYKTTKNEDNLGVCKSGETTYLQVESYSCDL